MHVDQSQFHPYVAEAGRAGARGQDVEGRGHREDRCPLNENVMKFVTDRLGVSEKLAEDTEEEAVAIEEVLPV